MTVCAGPLSTKAAVVLTLLLGVVVNIVRSVWSPDALDPLLTIALGVAVAVIALRAAMTVDELGLARASMRSGLRWSLGVIVVVVVGLAIAALVPATRSFLEDDRTQISFGSMLWQALVVIPIATVVVEELVFRGVLLGLFQRLFSPRRALVVCAVVFGLWHLLPVWRGGGAGDLSGDGDIGRLGAVAGTFVATFVAGLGFGWLRQRASSLIAPICAHVATNSATLAAAWFVAR